MASIVNYGLKALVTAGRICVDPGCRCASNQEFVRKRVNKSLGPAHQLDEATYIAICRDLDQNPISDRPETSTGEKQRDDGNFERVVEEAFKAFREQEREIALIAPKGSCVGAQVSSCSDDSSDDKFWIGAAHLRHHLEILLVLKGVKPCVLFTKYAAENGPLFSTVVIDCLVPIMDRLDLWSYGFSISYMSGEWVFYDARSPKMPLINKAFLTHPSVKKTDRVTYPERGLGFPGISDIETAQALGYPAPFDDWQSGRYVTIRDATELEVLASAGWPEDQRCCVQGMAFTCPAGDESVWKKVLDFHRHCEEAAKSVGTELVLFTGTYPEMTAWLEGSPGMLDGLSWLGCNCSPRMVDEGPTLEQIIELMSGADVDNMDLNDLSQLFGRVGLRLRVPDENVEGSDDHV